VGLAALSGLQHHAKPAVAQGADLAHAYRTGARNAARVWRDGGYRWEFKCQNCSRWVEDRPENWNLFGYPKELLCAYCGSFINRTLVAIYGVHVSKLDKATPGMLTRSEEVGSGLRILTVKRKRDMIAVRYLNRLARKEVSYFRGAPRDDFNTYLLLLGKTPIGYLLWTDGINSPLGIPTIRQLFVVKGERRKGRATKLVQHFIHELHGPVKGVLFCVEGANKATLELLAKIGHVRVEGDYYVGLDVGLLDYCT